MTDKERIEALEKQVSELTEKLKTSGKQIIEWRNMSAYINQEIEEIFCDVTCHTGGAQFKGALTTIVGKSFRKNTVMAMNKDEIAEAKPFIDYILDFARTTRKKYENEQAISGYERKNNQASF
ncbi:hypothetical protein HYH82_15480 [Clostridium botulinum]|uniref:hypothetical protein n=1 Tax=Clostridium botulinum TaxID=1491 RepID=UPI001C9B0665|nr:hypothetical protein [Clostridium botulinum]MBY6758694.1 hypothetical protein [Clostridium botulinum]